MIYIDRLKQIVRENFVLKHDSLHGVTHLMNVYNNAIMLAKQYDDVDEKVITAFSFLHDCKRESEGKDSGHGKRAADYIKTLDLGLSPGQQFILDVAIRKHDLDFVSKEHTIAVCLDADRLDLTRVGVICHPALMSTELGKYIAEKMQYSFKICLMYKN